MNEPEDGYETALRVVKCLEEGNKQLRANLESEIEYRDEAVEDAEQAKVKIEAALAKLEYYDKVWQVCLLCRVQLWCTFRYPQKALHDKSCIFSELRKTLRGEEKK